MTSAANTAQVTRSINCFRIGTPQWLSDERFAALLALFDRYPGVTDEVTFFTSETHPPLPLEVLRDRCALLSRRMDEVRRHGYQTGINILATIGHHEENLPNSLDGPYTRMTDPDGRISRGVLCPNDERARDYIREAYRLITEANPDYIWVDDDVRLFGHGPILAGCFCDTCLATFSRETRREWSRESLREAVNSGPLADRLMYRRAWLAHNRATIARLFSLIEQTVHAIRPGLPIGFMTGERYFEGYDFDAWAEVLSGASAAPVRWRPGGGTYTDEKLDNIVGKAHDIGRQVAFLPSAVTVIQSEIENFPYQRLKKSAKATALEAAAYIAAGCTGAAYNVLSMYDEPLDEYEPLARVLTENRPFLDALAKAGGRSSPVGLHSGWSKDSFATLQLAEGDWLFPREGVPGGQTNEFHEIGIPPAYSLDAAQAVALTGNGVRAFDRRTLERILSGGAYLDAEAARALEEMGHAELVGFRVGEAFPIDAIEQFLPHPLCGAFAGRERDGRQSFWKRTAYALEPMPGAEPLARLVDYGRKELAACGLGVFENSLGGRVCVAGYAPWTFLQNLSTSSRTKAIVRWLSRETLPAYVESFHRIVLWVREPEPGRVAIALLNASLDPARQASLLVRTAANELRLTDMRMQQATVSAAGSDTPYRRFVLPDMSPWEMVLLEG